MSTIRFTFFERMGLGAYSAGKLEKAEAWFRKMEQLRPDSLRVMRNPGVVLLARGKSEEAEICLQKEEKRFGPLITATVRSHRATSPESPAMPTRPSPHTSKPSVQRNAELAQKAHGPKARGSRLTTEAENHEH